MKGVVLAGGLGTRLRPLTAVTNKHLLPVWDRPMLYFPLRSLVEAGVTEALIVVGGQSTEEIMKLCKDGSEFGFKRLYYAYQEGEGGIAAALSLTEEFAEEEDLCVLLGDNIFFDSLKEYKETWSKARLSGAGAMVLLTEVTDPQNYGVPTFDDKERILYITEKPERPASKFAVTGAYFYDWSVFDRIKNCHPSKRGEMEITDVNNSYAEEGTLRHQILNKRWIDAGSSIEALQRAGHLVGDEIARMKRQMEVEEYPELVEKQRH